MLRVSLLLGLSLLIISCGGDDSLFDESKAANPDASAGGSTGEGGATNEGGATGEGGATNEGGATGEGGATNEGGAPGSGGTPSNGGAPGNGGSPGVGGAPGTGGSPTCPTDLLWCVDRCVDITSDAENCGYCGIACMAEAECVNAKCECSGDLLMCGQKCVDTDSDIKHCGGCNHACGTGMTCEGGECVCNAGLDQCGSKCVNLNTDQNNCGACGVHCSQPCQYGDCPVATFQECLPKPAGFSSCNQYCESIGKICLDKCPGDDGGAYGRYFDEACTQMNMTTGTCSDYIEGSSSIMGFRCCCE